MFFTALLIQISALLPYLPGGLRIEHLTVPALAGLAVLQARRVHPGSALIVGGLMIGAGAAVLFGMSSNETGIMAEPMSQFVRLFLPALMMMAFPFALRNARDPSLVVAKTLVVAAATVGMFTAMSIVSPQVREIMPLWVRDEAGGVWLNSQAVGRNTGIFNQPIEAGIFYSVALISVVHVLKYSSMSRIIVFGGLLLILFGGALSLSKNFIVLGAACAIGYAFATRLIPRALAGILSVPVVLSAPVFLERYNANYFDALSNLYYDGGLIAALSAGRFGGGAGTVSILFTSLFESGDWVMGRGLGSYLPLDNGFLEYLYQGGIVALAGYLLSLATLTYYGLRNRQTADGKLLIVLMIYIWLASTGGPTVTASRANVATLLLVSACVVGIRYVRGAGVGSPSKLRQAKLPAAAVA